MIALKQVSSTRVTGSSSKALGLTAETPMIDCLAHPLLTGEQRSHLGPPWACSVAAVKHERDQLQLAY